MLFKTVFSHCAVSVDSLVNLKNGYLLRIICQLKTANYKLRFIYCTLAIVNFTNCKYLTQNHFNFLNYLKVITMKNIQLFSGASQIVALSLAIVVGGDTDHGGLHWLVSPPASDSLGCTPFLFGNNYQQVDKPLVKIANVFTKRVLFSINQ